MQDQPIHLLHRRHCSQQHMRHGISGSHHQNTPLCGSSSTSTSILPEVRQLPHRDSQEFQAVDGPDGQVEVLHGFSLPPFCWPWHGLSHSSSWHVRSRVLPEVCARSTTTTGAVMRLYFAFIVFISILVRRDSIFLYIKKHSQNSHMVLYKCLWVSSRFNNSR